MLKAILNVKNILKNTRDDLKNEFNILDSFKYQNNKYYNDILSNNKIVSICVRQNRYSEREGNYNKKLSVTKSNKFTHDTIQYIIQIH